MRCCYIIITLSVKTVILKYVFIVRTYKIYNINFFLKYLYTSYTFQVLLVNDYSLPTNGKCLYSKILISREAVVAIVTGTRLYDDDKREARRLSVKLFPDTKLTCSCNVSD